MKNVVTITVFAVLVFVLYFIMIFEFEPAVDYAELGVQQNQDHIKKLYENDHILQDRIEWLEKQALFDAIDPTTLRREI